MRHYATLFDSKYLARGLVLYESLQKQSSEPFTLHALAMDDATGIALRGRPNLEVADLYTLELALGLHRVRASRSWKEYCWTLASVFSGFLAATVARDVTYLDADMFFFSDPKIIFEEIGDASIAVVPHRLIPEKKHLEVNGKFNVSWVTFKHDSIGRGCLQTWAVRCLERCSADIGCGDQVYLDDWPERYGEACHIIENVGAGLAPWNLANYKVTPGPKVDGTPVVFYHFHEYQNPLQLTNYDLRPEDRELIYAPYIAALSRQ